MGCQLGSVLPQGRSGKINELEVGCPLARVACWGWKLAGGKKECTGGRDEHRAQTNPQKGLSARKMETEAHRMGNDPVLEGVSRGNASADRPVLGHVGGGWRRGT